MASTMFRVAESPGFGRHTLPNSSTLVDPNELRNAFAMAMSHMYRSEVPLYGDLMRIVHDSNMTTANYNTDLEHLQQSHSDTLERITLERHGAIRLGQPMELMTVRRIFALLGMHPIGYYDLSAAGLPMHATCFRPKDESSLEHNPFRVFTTLLRPNLLRSDKARDLALKLLSKRNIFSINLMHMLDTAEQRGGRLYPEEATIFIEEALQTFSWAPVAASTHDEYQVLKQEHPILADIACFKTAHINHLTPRTLDISITRDCMGREGMDVKDRIEGPPKRKCPILLRQTSFLALEEPINFPSDHDKKKGLISGSHKARFGEIEERGAAVTPAGRKLYDELLEEATEAACGLGPEGLEAALTRAFERYPDTWSELRQKGLIYCQYQFKGLNASTGMDVTEDSKVGKDTIERLIDEGVIEATPITYEDFLPFSAAGIFQSNLGGRPGTAVVGPGPDIAAMEAALQCSIIDPDDLYDAVQRRSLLSTLSKLGLRTSKIGW